MLLPNIPGSSVLTVHHQAELEIAADRMLADRSRHAGRDIGQRAHLQRHSRRREAVEQGRILLGAQAVPIRSACRASSAPRILSAPAASPACTVVRKPSERARAKAAANGSGGCACSEPPIPMPTMPASPRQPRPPDRASPSLAPGRGHGPGQDQRHLDRGYAVEPVADRPRQRRRCQTLGQETGRREEHLGILDVLGHQFARHGLGDQGEILVGAQEAVLPYPHLDEMRKVAEAEARRDIRRLADRRIPAVLLDQ
jgi:hypothetical protein